MKSVIKNRFARMQKFAGTILCIIFFVASGCDKSNSSPESKYVYPEKGKYGLNILVEEFVEAQKNESGSSRPVVYSVRAKLPEGNSSLKIVIKSARPKLYECRNHLPPAYPEFDHQLKFCGAKFFEWHEICPECGGGKYTMSIIEGFRSVGFYQGSDVNWLIINEGHPEFQFTFTYVDELVHKDGKVADASVTVDDDFIIEYYENGATVPTKVKEVKVID